MKDVLILSFDHVAKKKGSLSIQLTLMRALVIIGILFSLSLKAYASQDTLYVFDLDSCLQNNPNCYTENNQYVSAYGYDFVKMAAVLQGIVNRDSAGNKIFYLFDQTSVNPKPQNFKPDEFWLSYLSQPGQYLSGYTEVRISPDSFYTQLLPHFKDMVKGIVLWSDSIPATSNVASTICGIDDYLPARKGGELDSELVEHLGQLPDTDLAAEFSGNYTTIPGTTIPTTGSKKCDVYLWAMDKYINTGEVNPTLLEYAVDAYSSLKDQNNQIMYTNQLYSRMLTNADYYIANRAFFVDLDPRSSNIPNDDPNQAPGTDYQTFQKILAALRAKADTSVITVGGFVPWQFKYTNGTTGDAVNAEWSTVDLFSSYYAQLDADAPGHAGLTNASIYWHIPLDPNLKQNNDKGRNGEVYSTDTNYVCFYMGDYDSGAWTSTILPVLWNSSGRGQIPLAWSEDPNLSRRVPQIYNYIYETATKNDYFVSGDNGAGYLNSIQLPSQYIPYWFTYQKNLFQRFDLSIAGFVITGFSGSLPLSVETQYSELAPDGVGVNTHGDQMLVNGVPFVTVHDLSPSIPTNATQVEQGLLQLISGTGNVIFVRTILTNPEVLVQGVAQLNTDYPGVHLKVIDPYTAFRFYEPVTGIQNPGGVGDIPKSFEMFQNYPNPFNPSTTIKYDIPQSAHVQVVIYNTLGQTVATLVNGIQAAGRYSVDWDAMRYSSGVYLSQIRAESLDRSKDFVESRKMLYLK